jgi:hypothetical protein
MADNGTETLRSEAPPVDEGLRCPRCDYNLTGLPDGRCPECGRAFQRRELLDLRDSLPAPFPIWDERDEIGRLSAFLRTLRLAWFSPRELLRRMPSRPNLASGRRFSLWCYAIAAILPGAVLAVILPRGFVAFVPLTAAGLFTIHFFERTMPSVLMYPGADINLLVRDARWSGVMQAMSCHAMVVGLAFALQIPMMCGVEGPASGVLFFSGLILLALDLCFWVGQLLWLAYGAHRRVTAVLLNAFLAFVVWIGGIAAGITVGVFVGVAQMSLLALFGV